MERLPSILVRSDGRDSNNIEMDTSLVTAFYLVWLNPTLFQRYGKLGAYSTLDFAFDSRFVGDANSHLVGTSQRRCPGL